MVVGWRGVWGWGEGGVYGGVKRRRGGVGGSVVGGCVSGGVMAGCFGGLLGRGRGVEFTTAGGAVVMA